MIRAEVSFNVRKDKTEMTLEKNERRLALSEDRTSYEKKIQEKFDYSK